jgi:Protein phosphatase 2C
MHAAIATQAGSQDSPNEDWAGVLVPGLAVVLDGLSAPDGTGTGCRHGTPWFVSQLGPRVLTLAADPSRSLVDALAEAIQQVASLHPGCDLKHPGTPSATMVLLRAHDERANYLALADAVLLLDTADGLNVVSDERVNQLAGKEREAANRVPTGSALKLRRRAQLTRALRRARNRPGGYWVAAADPQAASQAVTGSLPGKTLHRAVLLSDGATRLVDPFGLATWEELLGMLQESGPDELLRQVRAAEAIDPEGRQWPRTKRSDDATVVYLALDQATSPQS